MRRSWVVGLLVASTLIGTTGVAGASNHRGSAKPHPKASPSSSVTILPVISCTTTFGAETPSGTFIARQLPATTSGHGLTFYSNGFITALGPAGWACSALVAGDGGQVLDIYPPGSPDYTATLVPKGAAVIQVEHDYTGHLPGAEEVCALFPNSAAAAEVKTSQVPCPAFAGEETSDLTSDVVRFTDPPNVQGSGAGSGGALSSVGAAIYPQLSFGDSDSVDISLLGCTLPKKNASLCSAVIDDFLVRNPPSYAGSTSSS
jgi:hypothetical protein